MVIASVTRARNHTDDVEWSSEDGTRTEHDFLCRCVEAAINAGATTINIPDTVGYTVPEEYFALIQMVRERVPNSDKARFSVHCHDDLGMAVANSLAGVRAGARQIECTINGIGERAGNAALEEVVMAMKVRNDVLPYWTNIDSHDADARLEAGVGGDLVPGAVQQGDRRPQRVRARERHPPGRHAQAHPDLRDHDAGDRRREADLAGDGQAFRPPRLRPQAGGAGLSSSPATSSRTRSCGSRRWPTARSTSTTRTSRRWSTRRSRTPRTASSSCR